jgi:hypothetical protein
MRRLVISGLGVGLIGMTLGLSGCGGGIEQGIPQDTKPQPIPSNVQTKMGPPPKRLPTPGHTGFRRGPASAGKVLGLA